MENHSFVILGRRNPCDFKDRLLILKTGGWHSWHFPDKLAYENRAGNLTWFSGQVSKLLTSFPLEISLSKNHHPNPTQSIFATSLAMCLEESKNRKELLQEIHIQISSSSQNQYLCSDY